MFANLIAQVSLLTKQLQNQQASAMLFRLAQWCVKFAMDPTRQWNVSQDI